MVARAAILTSKPTSPEWPFKNGLEVKELESPEPQNTDAVVKIQAAALNHRELWILKGLYPEIVHGGAIGADAVGILERPGCSTLEPGQRVLICPSVNWDSDRRGPKPKSFRILGLLPSPGTITDKMTIDGNEVVPCPEHLSTAEAAALPLAGLTAYRALFTKAEAKAGDYILITGIGGGVALFALQFAVVRGIHVYVTSSSEEKIASAVEWGAKGGVNYKDPNAGKKLKELLGEGNYLSAIVDGAGGDMFDQFADLMMPGGIISQYGQTAGPGVRYTMDLWFNNVELRGSTMGSRAEFKEMVDFVDKHKIKPIVSKVFKGLTQENVDDAITYLSGGQQLGKVVIEIDHQN
ncbi:hypothetical protein BDA99DRAFT_608377 [Phascolomyces articulosus]|uniref:Enoyl reductase (ER) domain-containing protein n=1 Tax=Phascolomyces articulosus TaxID=60185 RepID=A0AAD5P9W7_9FUNG|nr:hypothetical protein BDA99DRAFT_608377 [Phascolomyces articulosus]